MINEEHGLVVNELIVCDDCMDYGYAHVVDADGYEEDE